MVSPSKPASDATAIASMLDVCYKSSNPALCPQILKWAMKPDRLMDPRYLHKILLPFVPLLKDLLVKKDILPTMLPYSSAFEMIIKHWLKYCLDPRSTNDHNPEHTIQRNTCTCDKCKRILKFFNAPSEYRLELGWLDDGISRHVEKILKKYAAQAANYVVKTRLTPRCEVSKKLWSE
jgi:hypothetical protein